MQNTNVIGIDCSTEPRSVGLALLDVRRRSFIRAEQGGRRTIETVVNWIADSPRVLLALDAPLGWPAAFSELARHGAGEPVKAARHEAFNRVTDRFVKDRIGQQPLRVGADLIAMTAHWALEMLSDVRRLSGEPIPLAWQPSLGTCAVIEVYPAATLRAHGLRCAGYKKDEDSHREARSELLRALAREVDVSTVADCAIAQSDVLDAIVCCLAGLDFLSGAALPPTDRELARKEGWIWVRDPAQMSVHREVEKETT